MSERPQVARTPAGLGLREALDDAGAAPRFMSVRQLAAYLQVNEKKVYALAAEGALPGTKVTGKWLFPRELVDRWLLESSHGGVLTDRLLLVGGEDLLLQRLVADYAQALDAHALVSYFATGTRLGLALLDRGRADLAAIHWGPAAESERRHPALLRHYRHHRDWVLVRAFSREQGLLLGGQSRPADLRAAFDPGLRWVLRQDGSGTHRYLIEAAARGGVDPDRLNVVERCASEREAAARLVSGKADVAPGSRAVADEFGLGFLPAGWENLDLVLARGAYFRDLFQQLLQRLKAPLGPLARAPAGYDHASAGKLVWMR